ncbi:uncharacterized protein PHALS_07631 [Plasmopara halstedii]|uniref:Uncharacterized protein n=1 Tax=Plasmopara halstedii TaxID=4781 RepID=A0A0P1B803_PLAHL|nr:uncharacterized protein PHALS_07631 [Plasmopara halstedii]CEG49894.1 hypothetical protein PHALS_07631 [Plasmopara halstedii]|eukprot:XP_024586263.1 hypothetical protein PHALS_07631 [Plasmopara halstedii]
MTLCPMYQPHGYGYWRFPMNPLHHFNVVDVLLGEGQQVLRNSMLHQNPAKFGNSEKKKSMRRQIQAVQRKLRNYNDAATRYRIERKAILLKAFHAGMNTYRGCMSQARCYIQDSAFDFQARNLPGFFFVILAVVPDHHPESQRELLDTIGKRLTKEDQALQKATISGAKLTDALNHMKADSAPGMLLTFSCPAVNSSLPSASQLRAYYTRKAPEMTLVFFDQSHLLLSM